MQLELTQAIMKNIHNHLQLPVRAAGRRGEARTRSCGWEREKVVGRNETPRKEDGSAGWRGAGGQMRSRQAGYATRIRGRISGSGWLWIRVGDGPCIAGTAPSRQSCHPSRCHPITSESV
jgi:hypothetical protein